MLNRIFFSTSSHEQIRKVHQFFLAGSEGAMFFFVFVCYHFGILCDTHFKFFFKFEISQNAPFFLCKQKKMLFFFSFCFLTARCLYGSNFLASNNFSKESEPFFFFYAKNSEPDCSIIFTVSAKLNFGLTVSSQRTA